MEPLEFFFLLLFAAVDFLGTVDLPPCVLFLFHTPHLSLSPVVFARHPTIPPTHTRAFAYSPHVLPLHLRRDICIHPTRPRLATCSNPPPNMVEKLYVTYNDVCICPYTP